MRIYNGKTKSESTRFIEIKDGAIRLCTRKLNHRDNIKDIRDFIILEVKNYVRSFKKQYGKSLKYEVSVDTSKINELFERGFDGEELKLSLDFIVKKK